MCCNSRVKFFVTMAVLALACGVAAADEPLRVLFIGNSFTAQSIADTFKRLAMDAGFEPPDVVDAAVVSQTLEWHTTDPGTLADIDAGGYDFVVLQEYSTRPTDATLPEADPLQFKQDATWLYDRVKLSSPDAQIVLFETWAREETHSVYPTYYDDRDDMQAQLNYHYHDAADSYIPTYSSAASPNDVFVAPVGEAWELNYHGVNMMLHYIDRYHADYTGRYLTASVIYSMIYQRSVAGRTPQLDLTWEQASYLQSIADATTGVTAPGGPDGQRGLGVFMGSFEKPVMVNDSAFTNRMVSGWTVDSGTTNGLGVRNSKDDLFAGTTKVGGVDQTLPAPAEGYQFLWVNSGEVSQQLVDELLPNTQYALTVAVGRILKSNYLDTNYYIKLYAGDDEIQTLTGDTANLPLGAFTDEVISFHTGPDVVAGRPLRIHLGREGAQISSRLAFDNVKLSVRIDGDYNGDGLVSGADYVVWADTFGNDGSPGKEDLRADGNGDGSVSGADYVLWANNFGLSR